MIQECCRAILRVLKQSLILSNVVFGENLNEYSGMRSFHRNINWETRHVEHPTKSAFGPKAVSVEGYWMYCLVSSLVMLKNFHAYPAQTHRGINSWMYTIGCGEEQPSAPFS